MMTNQRGIDDGLAAGPGVAPVIDMTEGDERSRAAYLRGFGVAQRHGEKIGIYSSPQDELERLFRESRERSQARHDKIRINWGLIISSTISIVVVIVIILILTGAI